MKQTWIPYPIYRILAHIRRQRSEKWARRWKRYAQQNNVKPIHD